MKKLLALFLCLALLVSVVPGSAFAAPDLSPAYAAMETLGKAYSALGGAVAGVNVAEGFDALYKQLFLGVKYTIGGTTIDFYSESTYPNVFTGPIDPGLKSRLAYEYSEQARKSPLNYESLFQIAADYITFGYNYTGEAVIGSVAYATQEFTENLNKTIADKLASLPKYS